MNSQRFESKLGIRRSLPLLCMVLAVLLWTSSARAGLIVSVESVTAAAGSTGNTLEVDLQNTGSSALAIGAFSFGISTTTSNIDFTLATTGTTINPYIFATDSGAGPNINTSSGLSLIASDFSTSLAGDTLGAGVTLGLGEVFFNVAAGTSPGPITVTLTPPPTTSLADAAGDDLSSSLSFSNGTITVTPAASAVPEPSTLMLFSTGLAMLAARAMGRRRRN